MENDQSKTPCPECSNIARLEGALTDMTQMHDASCKSARANWEEVERLTLELAFAKAKGDEMVTALERLRFVGHDPAYTLSKKIRHYMDTVANAAITLWRGEK